MDNYALVKDGKVMNVIVWDGQAEWARPDGHQLQIVPKDETVAIGFTFDGGKFAEPEGLRPPPPPVEEPRMPMVDPDPLTRNAIGYTTVAPGPLTVGKTMAVDGKPGLWLIGDRIPGIEAYSVTRVA